MAKGLIKGNELIDHAQRIKNLAEWKCQAMRPGGARSEWKYLYTVGNVKTGEESGLLIVITGTGTSGRVVSASGSVKSLIQPQANFTSCPDKGCDAAASCLAVCNQLCRYRLIPIFWLKTSMRNTAVIFVMVLLPAIDDTKIEKFATMVQKNG